MLLTLSSGREIYGPARGLPRNRGPLIRLLHNTALMRDYEIGPRLECGRADPRSGVPRLRGEIPLLEVIRLPASGATTMPHGAAARWGALRTAGAASAARDAHPRLPRLCAAAVIEWRPGARRFRGRGRGGRSRVAGKLTWEERGARRRWAGYRREWKSDASGATLRQRVPAFAGVRDTARADDLFQDADGAGRRRSVQLDVTDELPVAAAVRGSIAHIRLVNNADRADLFRRLEDDIRRVFRRTCSAHARTRHAIPISGALAAGAS